MSNFLQHYQFLHVNGSLGIDTPPVITFSFLKYIKYYKGLYYYQNYQHYQFSQSKSPQETLG